jgi:pimeloyl-ACP methyl ester carboxylesterase
MMSNAKSTLIPVVNTTNSSRRADAIFVHGINANPRTTWMTDNKLEGFPEESWLYWLNEDLPDLAVWTLGYPASASGWKGFTMELKDRTDNITNLLLNHPDLAQNRPIIFVTHSMGGLLVKQILRRALSGDYPNAESLIERTKGIVFLSTPHRGSDLANFIERLAFVLPSVNVSELKKDEPTLIDLNNWFCLNFNRLDLQVRVFCETQPTPVSRNFLGNLIRKIVVDKDSATLALPDVSVTPLDADHSSICWVKSYQFRKQDQLYGNVLQFIGSIIKNKGNSEPISLPNNESALELTPKDSKTLNKEEVLKILERILPVQFNQLLFKLDVPRHLMPGEDKPQTERAIALLEWAEAPGGCGLEKIKQALDELLT